MMRVVRTRPLSRMAGLLCLLMLLSHLPISIDGSAVSAAPATTMVGHHDQKNPNFLLGIVSYVKDQAVRTAMGCGKLYTNHSRCNAIRAKLKANRQRVKQFWEAEGLYENDTPSQIQKRLQDVMGGISYDEYIFLERGKEDRGKLFNVVFLMFGAPKFLPYALMFNPDLLPSSFVKEEPFVDLSRGPAILTMLSRVEQEAAKEPQVGLIPSILGRKQQMVQQHAFLNDIVTQTTSIMKCFPPNATQLTQSILAQIPRPEGRHEERLAHLPPVIIQTMNRVVTGQAFPSLTAQLLPTFLQRGKLVAHLQKVAASDHFLRTNSLETIQSKRLLQEACRDRLLETSKASVAELRQELQQWLEATSGTTVQNNNAALLGLLAYNGCYQIRKDQERTDSLTRLLFTSPDAPVVGIVVPMAEGSTSTAKVMSPSRWGRN
jgi:hypothetical protein